MTHPDGGRTLHFFSWWLSLNFSGGPKSTFFWLVTGQVRSWTNKDFPVAATLDLSGVASQHDFHLLPKLGFLGRGQDAPSLGPSVACEILQLHHLSALGVFGSEPYNVSGEPDVFRQVRVKICFP